MMMSSEFFLSRIKSEDKQNILSTSTPAASPYSSTLSMPSMTQSILLQLMGVDFRGDYSNARAQWRQVERRILSHPTEASIPHYPSNDCHSFSPLYIALRNEVHPVPLSVVNQILHVNPQSLMDEILHIAIINPHTTGAIMSRLLELNPQFSMTKYKFWDTPLHAFATSAKSVEAFKILIESNPSALTTTDCQGRIPIFHACSEGSSRIVQLMLDKGKDEGLCAGGLFAIDNNGKCPLHCVISRIGLFDTSYNRHWNYSQHCYLKSNYFKEKCFNAWKALTICIIFVSDRDSIESNWTDYTSMVLLATIEIVGFQKTESKEMPAVVDWNEVFHLLLDNRYCDPYLLASTPDQNGRLPFHMALENQLTFRDGLLHILNAFPEAIFYKDFSDTLMPRIMEVLGKKSGLNIMFSVLSNAPSVLNNADPGRFVKRTCLKRYEDEERETRNEDDQSLKKKQRAGSAQNCF